MTYNLESAKGGQVVAVDTPFAAARGLWVGVTGDVNVRFVGGGSAIYYNVTGFLPVDCTEVLSAGTTATNMTTMI